MKHFTQTDDRQVPGNHLLILHALKKTLIGECLFVFSDDYVEAPLRILLNIKLEINKTRSICIRFLRKIIISGNDDDYGIVIISITTSVIIIVTIIITVITMFIILIITTIIILS